MQQAVCSGYTAVGFPVACSFAQYISQSLYHRLLHHTLYFLIDDALLFLASVSLAFASLTRFARIWAYSLCRYVVSKGSN